MSDKETWKDIPGYEGYYQASNLGRIRSVDRYIKTQWKTDRFCKARIMSQNNDGYGYKQVRISKNHNPKTMTVHVLTAMAFLNHKPKKGLVVDHIDKNPANNRLENLQVITHRENLTKDKGDNFGAYPVRGKWHSTITINKVRYNLGLFATKAEARNAYKNKLDEYEQKPA